MSNFQRRIVQDNHTSHSAQGTLTNASAAILTAGDDEVLTVDSIFLTEYSGNARTVTLRHIDSGDVDDGLPLHDGSGLASRRPSISKAPLFWRTERP